ncbi:hypothetical protein F5Y09DRAFT_320071 [Xylaria sp. FL1042]|nr:hypothetical protein F5Y09DRAFT_320071 [Xylaria sp. FL1042]
MPDGKKIGKATRQPHRKSRNGCLNCKRRKVKCDELRPQCARCFLFGQRCMYAGDPTNSELSAPESLPITPSGEPSRPRGRGRPRKNWDIDIGTPTCLETTSPSASAASGLTTHSSTGDILNIDDAELLLHFTQVTAPSLAGYSVDNSPMQRFWSYNLPRIGLTHHFVLRLAYAVAAYHIAHPLMANDSKRLKYRDMAEQHASLGLRQLTQNLACIDKDNCGAAYIAATLVCYCTFAAGPTGPGDLLVCNLEAPYDAGWLPLIFGVRFIREEFPEDVLFAGLMEPFMGKNHPEPEGAQRPRCYREGFKRLDWEEPLQKLRGFIVSQEVECTETCLRGVDGLILIYEAIFGYKDANFDGPSQNQFVFGWLYRLQKQFISCLRQKNPSALIILAYYAVLLGTETLWNIDGWANHLLATVSALVEDDYTVWLQWPTESLQQQMRYN